jgi:hypothetical protein
MGKAKKFATNGLLRLHNSNGGKWGHPHGVDCISVAHGLDTLIVFVKKSKNFPAKNM